MTTEAKTPRNRIRGVISAVALVALVGIMTSPLTQAENQALAAGEVITVEPGTAASGDFITVTVSRISTSSFCDYLPYAGDGYYMRVYLYNYDTGENFYLFPQQSEAFNPRTQQSLTLRVGPIPDRYPLGPISVVGDCMYPDGRQTGNTAIPFTLTVVERGQAAPAPAPEAESAPAPTPAPPAEPAQAAEGSTDVAAAGLGEDTLTEVSERQSRSQPSAPAGLTFRVAQSDSIVGSSGLFLMGKTAGLTSDLTIELTSGESRYVLSKLSPTNGLLRTEIFVPIGLEPGTYELRAITDRDCIAADCPKMPATTVTISDDGYQVLGEEIALAEAAVVSPLPAMAWMASGTGLLLALGAGAMWVLIRNRSSAPSL